MVRVFIVIMIASVFCAPSFAVSDDPENQDFVTSTVTSVFDKVGKVVSGEEPIISEKAMGMDEVEEGYTRDALGRKVPDATIRGGELSKPDEKL